jgi:hypothetical protein
MFLTRASRAAEAPYSLEERILETSGSSLGRTSSRRAAWTLSGVESGRTVRRSCCWCLTLPSTGVAKGVAQDADGLLVVALDFEVNGMSSFDGSKYAEL